MCERCDVRRFLDENFDKEKRFALANMLSDFMCDVTKIPNVLEKATPEFRKVCRLVDELYDYIFVSDNESERLFKELFS